MLELTPTPSLLKAAVSSLKRISFKTVSILTKKYCLGVIFHISITIKFGGKTLETHTRRQSEGAAEHGTVSRLFVLPELIRGAGYRCAEPQ